MPNRELGPSAEVREMTLQEWERKVRELETDHIAAGGFISREEAEKVIEEAYGPSPLRRMQRRRPAIRVGKASGRRATLSQVAEHRRPLARVGYRSTFI